MKNQKKGMALCFCVKKRHSHLFISRGLVFFCSVLFRLDKRYEYGDFGVK